MLTFYLTDDYQGGMDRFYEGDRMVGEAPNMKAEHRFVEVALDGEKIWEEDLLGPNPFPWPHRLRTIDVTDLVRDKEQVEVSITVVDRQSTEDPFWSEVFVSRVALLESIPSIEKAGSIEVPVDGPLSSGGQSDRCAGQKKRRVFTSRRRRTAQLSVVGRRSENALGHR